MNETERARTADKRALIQQARAKVEELDLLLSAWRRRRRAAPRIVYKTNFNALQRPRHRSDDVYYRR